MWAARRVAWGIVNAPLEVASFFVNDVAHFLGQIADWTYDKAYPASKSDGMHIKVTSNRQGTPNTVRVGTLNTLQTWELDELSLANNDWEELS